MSSTIRPEISRRIIELVRDHWPEIQASGRNEESNKIRSRAWLQITETVRDEYPELITDIRKIKKHWLYIKFQAREKTLALKRKLESSDAMDQFSRRIQMELTPTQQIIFELFKDTEEFNMTRRNSFTPHLVSRKWTSTSTSEMESDSVSDTKSAVSMSKHYQDVDVSFVESNTMIEREQQTQPISVSGHDEGERISPPKRLLNLGLQSGVRKRTFGVAYSSDNVCSIRNLQAKVLKAQLENETLRREVLSKANRLLDKAESVGLVELLAQAYGAVFFDVETVDNDL